MKIVRIGDCFIRKYSCHQIPPSANPDQVYEIFGLDRSTELIVTAIVGPQLEKEYLEKNASVFENLLVSSIYMKRISTVGAV